MDGKIDLPFTVTIETAETDLSDEDDDYSCNAAYNDFDSYYTIADYSDYDNSSHDDNNTEDDNNADDDNNTEDDDTEDDDESIVVIDEDYGDQDEYGDQELYADLEDRDALDNGGEHEDDVYEDAIEEQEVSDDDEIENGVEDLEWHYEFGPAYPASDISPRPQRHANCGYATCDSDEEDDYEKVPFENVDTIPLN